MTFESRNPASAEVLEVFENHNAEQLQEKLDKASRAVPVWRSLTFEQRGVLLRRMAQALRDNRESLARTMTSEMGKLVRESLAEVDKCALVCDHYADHSAAMLADQPIPTTASSSYVSFEPLGTVLAIMPWNFPLWQVFRFLAPTLMAGNTALLKHAPNVPGCALAVESICREAGLPPGVFGSLLISVEQTEALLADERIQGVAFTGSEAAGRRVAELAGRNLKKAVLELGGSDPFVVLDDADIDRAAEVALRSRFGNAGQTCVAAKRFILTEAVAEPFIARLRERAATLLCGDPLAEGSGMAPMARADLREKLHGQVVESIAAGAEVLMGCELPAGDGFFYPASILGKVTPGMPAFDDELFGPVAAIVRARDEAHALQLANQTRYGLGASVWTADSERGERFARQLQAGSCFINALVASDVRMPFGGIKASGMGRELASYGLQEFCNIKSVWNGG